MVGSRQRHERQFDNNERLMLDVYLLPLLQSGSLIYVDASPRTMCHSMQGSLCMEHTATKPAIIVFTYPLSVHCRVSWLPQGGGLCDVGSDCDLFAVNDKRSLYEH